MAFLLIFFYVMLMDFQKYEVSILEYILMGWVGVLILEEVRQVGLSFTHVKKLPTR